jgi:hypothetical protein
MMVQFLFFWAGGKDMFPPQLFPMCSHHGFPKLLPKMLPIPPQIYLICFAQS